MKTLFLIFFFSLISLNLFSEVYASPQRIILIRHTDKLAQKLPGPALSATGYIRALKLSYYFLNRFGEPDFVIAGKPKGKNASIRELQTVGPLVNILAERHPDVGFSILHPFTHEEYKELTNYLLHDKKFDDKLILICWRHTKIVELAHSLGVKDQLLPWPDDDYDSVYILDYNSKAKVVKFRILHHQYPINNLITWHEVYQNIRNL